MNDKELNEMITKFFTDVNPEGKKLIFKIALKVVPLETKKEILKGFIDKSPEEVIDTLFNMGSDFISSDEFAAAIKEVEASRKEDK